MKAPFQLLHRSTAVATLAAGLFTVFTNSVRADENVPLDKLPAAVKTAIKERFPKADLVSAEIDKDEGKTEYEVKIKVDGKKKEVDVTPEGKITDVDDED